MSMQCTEASRICLSVLECMVHCTAANRLGLSFAVRASINWLLVHQSEPKSSMRRGCFYGVFIFDLAEENAQLFFGKVRQTVACKGRFSVFRDRCQSSLRKYAANIKETLKTWKEFGEENLENFRKS